MMAEDGMSPIHAAAQAGHIPCLTFLKSIGIMTFYLVYIVHGSTKNTICLSACGSRVNGAVQHLVRGPLILVKYHVTVNYPLIKYFIRVRVRTTTEH